MHVFGIAIARARAAAADLRVPETFSLSLFSAVTPKWDLMGDITWTRWSRLERRSMDNWILHQWVFDPSGRYHFTGISDYAGNSVETQEPGTFKVYGSLLLVMPDQGNPGVYSLEPVPPASLKIGGKEYSRQ